MLKVTKKDFAIVQKFSALILISLMIICAGIIHMAAFGLNIGIDYEGGAKID